MRLILIRHGEPDYKADGLTPKGKREVELLAKRMKDWKVDDVYTSPLGRAIETAKPCINAWQKRAQVLKWAQEFFYLIDDGAGGKRIPWDFLPSEWTDFDENFKETDWLTRPNMMPLKTCYDDVCRSLDAFLAGYGYVRTGRRYHATASNQKTVVIFCHFGVAMLFLSHLLNIPAQTLLHGCFLPPSSITILNTEQRYADEAYFRMERMGDCAHLIAAGERISESGYFANILQES